MVVAAGRSGLAVPVGVRLGPVSAVPDVEPADAAALRGLRLGHHRGVDGATSYPQASPFRPDHPARDRLVRCQASRPRPPVSFVPAGREADRENATSFMTSAANSHSAQLGRVVITAKPDPSSVRQRRCQARERTACQAPPAGECLEPLICKTETAIVVSSTSATTLKPPRPAIRVTAI